MSMKRPAKLVWTGKERPDGRPEYHLGDYGLPPRDISGDELDALSMETIRLAVNSGLYRNVDPKPEKNASATKRTTKASEPPAEETSAPETANDAPAEGSTESEG